VFPRTSFRRKLILSFLVVIVISGVVTSWVGVRLIGDEIIRRAQNRVRIDLNSAREIYLEELEDVKDVIRLTAARFFMEAALRTGDHRFLKAELSRIRLAEGLDVLTVTDRDGVVIFRARNPLVFGDSQAQDEIVGHVLSARKVVASTQIVPEDELLKEGEDLRGQVHMRLVPTQHARPRQESVETSGMMIKAAAPVFDGNGEIVGILYGGMLLNRNYRIVDEVKDVVYRGEKYGGKETGTATIFQGDLRVSTNVVGSDGNRAIGTRASMEVYDQVVGKGVPWIARAFVVNDWYITAYEPVRSVTGSIIGMLYVGMLEKPYVDLRNRVAVTFLGIGLLTAAGLIVVAYFSTSSIIKPLKDLQHATEKIAKGDLTYRVEPTSHDVIGRLSESFNTMTAELKKARDSYIELMRTLEDKVQEKTGELEKAQDRLVQSAKLSSLGKMAAGIAHEINNPLTSILINSHLIAEKLEGREDLDENLRLIIDETTRCGEIVQGLLTFSRQTPPKKSPANINDVVDDTLLLLKSQILVNKVEVRVVLDRGLPEIMIDVNKIKQVFTNIILNALEAMSDGGNLTIRSSLSRDSQSVEIEFADTGPGMPEETLKKIFDPFFTTKGVKGMGLGLSVSYGIVEQHGGSVTARSTPGEGATIKVSLPVREPQAP
jgi:two-component system NtrC family sensor kinase